MLAGAAVLAFILLEFAPNSSSGSSSSLFSASELMALMAPSAEATARAPPKQTLAGLPARQAGSLFDGAAR